MATDFDKMLEAAAGAAGIAPAGGATAGASRRSVQAERFAYMDHTYRSTGKLVPLGENGMTRLKRTNKGTIKASVDAAVGEWYAWDDAKRNAFASQAFALGYIKDPADLGSAESLWSDMVDKSANFASHGKKVTPQQVMAMYAGGNATGKKSLGPMGADGRPLANRTVVTKNRQVDITNPTQAKSIIDQAFRTSMGRAPTASEVRTLTRTLNAQQQANPSMAVDTQHYNSLGNADGTASRVTSGGLDANQYVSDQTQADPEAAAYQGATTYMSGLMSILKSGI